MNRSDAPRFSRALLRRALPPDVRDDITGDLDELLARELRASGVRAARRAYRRRAAGIALRFVIERARDRARSVSAPRVSLTDFRVGVRMLVRHPVLTVVSMASLALAVALGAAVFAFISLILWPRLPLPEGDRVVSVRLHDAATDRYEDRLTADLLRWQATSTSLGEFGAGRNLDRNLTMGDGVIESVAVAEVTASTFAMARVAPIAGRALTDADAAPAAAPVMMIGETLWRERFGGDLAIFQRPVTLAGTPTLVVGIMPSHFKFPDAHEVWTPLSLNPGAGLRSGAGLRVWARLLPGRSMRDAASEFDAFSAAAASAWPATHTHLRSEIAPFAGSSASFSPSERAVLASTNLAVAMLVVVISGNVALLMFARAATRESEILVRTALGATRGRLMWQFFSEALVLSTLAGAAGLALARASLGWGLRIATFAANDGQPLPFWVTPELPPLSIAYGCGLALLAALITGVLPAAKISRAVSSRLRQASAGGGGLRFGGVWTALIVAQIAVTVTFPVATYFAMRDGWQMEDMAIGIPPAEVLSARLTRDESLTREQFAAAVKRICQGLAVAPGVRHVTVADKLPLMWNGHYEIELDDTGAAAKEAAASYHVSTAVIDSAFFSTFDAPPLAGRLLTESDATGPPRVAVVNQSFVTLVLGGRNPVGRRLHYRAAHDEGQRLPSGTETAWLEIVGVVRDLAMAVAPDPKVAGVYLPLDLGQIDTIALGVRVAGATPSAANSLRELTRAEPLLRVTDVQPLDRVRANDLRGNSFWMQLTLLLSASALVLALSGIYAVMSFAVSRRMREIGIRVALGSSRTRIVGATLRLPFLQLGAGLAAGGALAALLAGKIVLTPMGLVGLMAYVGVMSGVCLLACVVPIRRALAVDPIEVLRAD